MNEQVVVISLAVLIVVLAFIALRLYLSMRRLRARYAPIIDVDTELTTVQNQLARATREQQEFLSENDRLRARLTQEYEQARTTYEALTREISLLEENLEDISFGLYRPHFSFQTSEEYKRQLETLRDRERRLIRDGRAALCSAQWTVGGSAKEGARMAKQNMKLVLRAFNGECDAALAKVAWNNISKMEERVRKSFDAINKLGTVLQVSITEEFLELKLDELRLTHEYEEKRHGKAGTDPTFSSYRALFRKDTETDKALGGSRRKILRLCPVDVGVHLLGGRPSHREEGTRRAHNRIA